MPLEDAMGRNAFALYSDWLDAEELFATDEPAALLALTAAQINVPHVSARPHTRTGQGSFLHFEGVANPRGFRGEHLTSARSFSAVYARTERSDATELLDLLEAAFGAADGRLMMKVTSVEGVVLEVVEIHEWVDDPQPGGISNITFTTNRVAGDELEEMTLDEHELDYAAKTSNQLAIGTAATDVTDLSVDVVVGMRAIKVIGQVRWQKKTAAGDVTVQIYDDTADVVVAEAASTQVADGKETTHLEARLTPAEGSRSYKIRMLAANNTVEVHAAPTYPSFLQVVEV